ncbi:lamin tail domain-containing protein [Lacinutrix iliipiscaria]|uniref:Lamin tail domain-containing protein n=1 Tax=Lacinutrix iliipiscaria TaxID=1230532 RepID=A0ABW5WNY0_9FLAO
MKKIYFLFALLISAVSFGQTSDLYFSMYGEGSSNNKFLEIYNGTGAAVNLDNYAFPNVSNAPTTAGEYEFWNTFPEGTMLADGDVFVIAHSSADTAITDEADMLFNFLSNGDDGFALVANDGTWDDADMDDQVDPGEMTGFTILDWIGTWQGDGPWDVAGVSNATTDNTLTRKSSVCGPNNDWADSAGVDADSSEWIVGASDSGWGNIGAFSGCLSDPVLTIGAPADMAVFPSGTTNVDLSVSVENFIVGDPGAGIDGHIHWTINGVAQPMKYDVDDEMIATVDGETYVVFMQLVDNSHTPITPAVNATVTFSVAFPCDLFLGTLDAVCDTETSGVDNYTASIEFTGGGSSTYTIDTGGVGSVGGDNPSVMTDGTILINDIPEGTNVTVTVTGDSADSSCDLSRTINSPVCIGTLVCPNVGDIIVTEIMKNPNAVADGLGEYFEVYNTTGSPIDMQGWDITDADGESHTIAATLIVPASGYAVLGINSDFATNGGVNVDYQYSSYTLSNGDDEVQLECSGTIIDAVAYTDADFPDTTGTSMELIDTAFDDVSNNDGMNWQNSTTDIGLGDFGTPGAPNSLSVDSFDLSSFNVYPNPTSTGIVNITSSKNEAILVSVYDILGKQVLNQTITNNVLNVSRLNSGVYILKMSQNGNVSTKKLVIK